MGLFNKAPQGTTDGEPTASFKETKPMAARDDEKRTPGEVNAVLGRGTEFEGKLTFEGEVRVAGKFTGEIFSKDRLQIDDTAKVHAEINAGSVIVYGEVVGNTKASQTIELKANARVKGNLETPTLIIEKGVIFEGCCKMENLKAGASPLKPVEDKK